jgi:hypothetical protein
MKQEKEKISDDDFVIKWWVEYIEADASERDEMVKCLPARVDLVRLLSDSEIDEDVKEQISIMQFGSLFSDCVDTCGYVFSKRCEDD